ncbi:MAG: rhodanese-like domain-containing protein [Myxococcota bacterium]
MTATLFEQSAAHPHGFREVSPTDALPHLAGLRLIDVRETAELDGPLGHLEGIEHVPLGTVPSAAPTWDRSTPILVICRSGGRSGSAAAHLAQLGFEQVFNLSGGMLAWNAAGLPLEREATR